jgi:lipopolysaccharide transport protein LptA
MPSSHAKCLVTPALLAGAVVALAQSGGDGVPGEPIVLEAKSFSFDRKANVNHYEDLRVDAGRWSVVANRANAHVESLDFKSGEWQFEGDVHVAIDTASIAAQGAVFTFDNQALVVGELWGGPVTFEDSAPDRDGPVIGQAERLRFDDRAGTVELLGNVLLTVGPYQTTGCDLVYFINEERFTTGSTTTCQEPFRTVIAPREEEQGEQAASEP